MKNMTLLRSRACKTRLDIRRLMAPFVVVLSLSLGACGHFATELRSQEELSDVADEFRASRYLEYQSSDDGYHYFRERGKFGPFGPSRRFKIRNEHLELGAIHPDTVFTYDQNRGVFVVGHGDRQRLIKANFTEKYTREEEEYLAAIAAAMPFTTAAPSPEKRTAWLKLLRRAYHAKRFEHADRYARTLLGMELTGTLPDRGENPVHVVQTILGLIALERNDLVKASRHLLASADLEPPVPAITRSEPSLALARRLAAAGQWGVVAQYLALSEKFWDKKDLDAWRPQIAVHRVPAEWRQRGAWP